MKRFACRAFVALLAVFAGTPGAYAQGIPMRIATGVDPGFAHFYVATQTDILKKQGLNVELFTGPSGGATIPLLIGGDSNASMSATLAGVRTHLVDPHVVAVGQVVAYDEWYGIVAQDSITSIAQLKGKKIGIALGTASETMWQRLLVHEKIDPKVFGAQIIDIQPPEMTAALERGDIDAFSSWEPWLSRTVMQLPKTHILRTNKGILLDIGFIYMNRDWIAANRPAAVAFMRGMRDATSLINTQPEEATKIVAAYLRLSPDLVKALLPKLTFSLKLDEQSYLQTKAIVDQMGADGKLKAPFDYAKWFDPSVLQATDAASVALPSKM